MGKSIPQFLELVLTFVIVQYLTSMQYPSLSRGSFLNLLWEAEGQARTASFSTSMEGRVISPRYVDYFPIYDLSLTLTFWFLF